MARLRRRGVVALLALYLAGAPGTGAAEELRPFVVGVDEDYFPFEFRDGQGRAAGADVELIAAAAREVGLELQFRPDSWGAMRRAIEDGSVDLLAGMFRTRQREQTLAFSSPHALVDYVAYVRAAGLFEAPPIRSLADLAGRRVLVEEGAVAQEVMERLAGPPRLVPVRSDRIALQLLAQGQADAAVVSELTGAAAVGQLRLSGLVRQREPVATFEYCFAARRDHRALVERLDAGLERVRASGEYDQIRRRWFGPGEDHRDLHRALGLAGLATAVLLALLAAGAFWNRSLRRQVAARTAELQRHQEHLEELVAARTAELERALAHVKRLSGLIPICASCKKVRDDRGFWTQVEQYVATHSEAEFSHGLCPECERRILGELEGRSRSSG